VTPYFQFIFKIFLKSVALCLITNPYNPKYSRLQNKNRFHVNEGLERRPLMMEEKSDENSGALALNETVGENCFLARTTPRPVIGIKILYCTVPILRINFYRISL
jgi:hypothetical protein